MNSKRLCSGFLIVLINMSLFIEPSFALGETESNEGNGLHKTEKSDAIPTVLPVSAKSDSNNVINSNTSPKISEINDTKKESITNKSNSKKHETSDGIENNGDDSSQDDEDVAKEEQSKDQELDENNELQSDDLIEEESENDTNVDHQRNQYKKLKLRREIDDNNENKDNKDLLKLNEQEIDDIKQFSENKISSIENEIKAASFKCQKACFECIKHSLKDLIEDAKVALENLQADKGGSESKMDNEKSKMASDLKYSFNTAQKDYDNWIASCKNNFPNGYCIYDSVRNSESMKNSVIIAGNAYWTEKCISHYMSEIIPPLYIEQVQKDFHELIKDIQKLYTQQPDLGKKNCLQCISIALESKYRDVGSIINLLKKEYISKQEKENYMIRAKDLLKTLYFSENQIDTQWKYSCLHFEPNVEIFENLDEQQISLLLNKDDDSNLLKCMHKYINMEHWLLLLQPEDDEDLELAFE